MATLSAPTLSRLIKEVRMFLNQPKAENSFWKDDELTVYINDAIRQYFLLIVEGGEGQFDTAVSLNIVSGTDTVALPTDCYDVRALYKVQTDCNMILRYNNNLSDGYETGTSNGSPTAYTPYYYFRGENIVLRPGPGFSETGGLYLEYTKFPETLITGMDVMTSNISPVFKELVVKYAVYQAKLKESSVSGGNTYQAVERHLADIVKIFKDSVYSRSKYPQFIKPFEP